MSEKNVKRDLQKEMNGWLFMAFLMFAFPTLFFLVVYLPIWMGWATAY